MPTPGSSIATPTSETTMPAPSVVAQLSVDS
jgi:hypothetical protein